MATLDIGGTLSLHRAMWADLGVWAGAGLPPRVVTLAEWEANRQGFWARLDGFAGIVPYTPTEQATERISVAESAVARLSMREIGRAESVGLTESHLTRFAMRAALSESITLGETRSDALSQATSVTESRSETVTVSEVLTALVAYIEARVETVTLSESRTSTWAQREPLTETPTVTETRTDQYAPVDPFLAFRLGLPLPLQAGKYPVAKTGGGWEYKTANDLFVTLLSATPRDNQFWIDSAGV